VPLLYDETLKRLNQQTGMSKYAADYLWQLCLGQCKYAVAQASVAKKNRLKRHL
jgi:hypothetical protein